jgi:hypothetical protein
MWRIAILAVLLVTALAAAACDPSDDDGAPETGSEGSATSPEIHQAKWKVTTRIAPGHNKLGKKRRLRVREQAKPIGDLVTELYDTLFLSPDQKKAVVELRFIPATARAWLHTKAGVAPDTSEVKTLRRKADIAIDAGTTRAAVARVAVKARGTRGTKSFIVVHDARLWLEKVRGRWKVVAFRVDQEPAR